MFGPGKYVFFFAMCRDNFSSHFVFPGTFAILGGPTEMPWASDRLFKYDVTNVFHSLNLRPDSDYHFEVQITAVNGTDLDSSLIRTPSVQFVPGLRGENRNLFFLKEGLDPRSVKSLS